MRVHKTGIAFGIAAILTACSSMDEKPLDLSHGGQAGVVTAANAVDQRKNVTGFEANQSDESRDKDVDVESQTANSQQSNPKNTDNAGLKQTVYFLYDSSEVEPEFIPLIEKYSQDLLNNSEQSLILEGHADERGSREYNIALGEERAKAVAKMMQARGVHPKQLEIVSYGEEKPASSEHSETAWHLNRRVNLFSPRTQK